MDLLPFVHMFQFYYYLLWNCFCLVAVIKVASFFVCRWGGVVSGLVDWDWDCCHFLSYG